MVRNHFQSELLYANLADFALFYEGTRAAARANQEPRSGLRPQFHLGTTGVYSMGYNEPRGIVGRWL